MKFVIAPDSYKESLSALQVAREVERGLKEIFPDAVYLLVPVADGGEGTVEAMIDASQGQRVVVSVTGPMGIPVEGYYGLLDQGRRAVIEMAAASGLTHVPTSLRNPMLATSRGTGELILSALDQGVKHIILGIGGSATNDGGMGMLKALGARFLDTHGREIGEGGGALMHLDHIDVSQLDPRLAQCTIEVACDVDNPLTGPQGASVVFGPQKGATPMMVQQLDAGLTHYARIIERDIGVVTARTPGAGAAGGMGAAAMAFLKAKLRPGIDIVLDALDFDRKLDNADFVITGEGRIDSQTLHGKTPIGVTRRAQARNIPVIGLAGCLSDDSEVVTRHGINAIFSVLRRSISLEEAYRSAADNVRRAARNIGATLALGIAWGQRHR